MTLDSSVLRQIEPRLAAACGAQSVAITGVQKLSGGAIQENWQLSADVTGGRAPGPLQWVLRKDSAAVVASSRSRTEEAALLRIVCDCGMRAPRPLLVDDGASVGFPFFVMEKLPGLAQGHRLTRDPGLVPDRQALMRDIGAQLALLHAIEPPQAELASLALRRGTRCSRAWPRCAASSTHWAKPSRRWNRHCAGASGMRPQAWHRRWCTATGAPAI